MKKLYYIIFTIFISLNSYAEDFRTLQQGFDNLKFGDIKESSRKNEVIKLNNKADELLAKYPDSAEIKIWSGIIKAYKAEVLNSYKSLGLINDSRDILEESIKLDSKAIKSSGLVALGTLYYKTLPRPFSFKSNKKAEDLLRQALKQNPENVEANYFYSEFLIKNDRLDEAKPYLLNTINLPIRQERYLADITLKKNMKNLYSEIYN